MKNKKLKGYAYINILVLIEFAIPSGFFMINLSKYILFVLCQLIVRKDLCGKKINLK